jgi:protein involved in polysaccharide export with SLBB domain
MTVTVRNIIPAKQMEAAQTTQYTSVAARTIIDSVTVTNTDTVNRTFSVNLVQSAGSPGNSNLIIDDRTVVPGETYRCFELVGQVLEPGAFISTIASAATALTIRANGREVT